VKSGMKRKKELSMSKLDESADESEDSAKKKKVRTTFTGRQIFELVPISRISIPAEKSFLSSFYSKFVVDIHQKQ
jgi:hypothetical protein